MVAALTRERWDVIISDYSMPGFGGLAALALVKDSKLDVPFILVSGTVNEEIAVEVMRAGAHDFMTKGKYARLGPAIERELRDAAVRAESRKLQEQLILSDRMVSMGTLAAGVAHEINNPLAALIANLDMIAEDISRADGDSGPGGTRDAGVDSGSLAAMIAGQVKDAREAARRIRNIAGDLKVFSRASDERSDAVELRHVIESSLRMAMNEIRHRARVTQHYAALPDVAGNESRLGQVFLNLLINAAQAIPEGAADRNEIRITTSYDGNGRVVAEVGDTGSGMPESVVNRIFDPFFTTKPVGVGTGLGLAICHRIVTAMGGEITVQSKVGEGTVFRVYLHPAAGQKRRVTPRSSPASASRKGRVLVIDDEPMLLGVIRRMLASEHMVEELSDAREALRRISAGERFDVILSDLMMPGMTGMELHAEVAKLDPDQAGRIIFVTGGAFTDRAREFLDAVPNPRLDKPFTVQELRGTVNAVID
ncbi:MAG: response regulator [Patescibacteria group bacterium]